MRGESNPADPTVLNTTVLSNFAYIDRVDLHADLSGVRTVPAVRDELRDGVDSHRFLQSALSRVSRRGFRSHRFPNSWRHVRRPP